MPLRAFVQSASFEQRHAALNSLAELLMFLQNGLHSIHTALSPDVLEVNVDTLMMSFSSLAGVAPLKTFARVDVGTDNFFEVPFSTKRDGVEVLWADKRVHMYGFATIGYWILAGAPEIDFRYLYERFQLHGHDPVFVLGVWTHYLPLDVPDSDAADQILRLLTGTMLQLRRDALEAPLTHARYASQWSSR